MGGGGGEKLELKQPNPEEKDGKKADVVKAGEEAHGDKADDLSKPLVETKTDKKTPSNDEGLPENEWTTQYYELKQQLKDNPNTDGPLMQISLLLLKLAAKYGHYMDLMPGSFAEKMTKDEKLKDLKLDKEKTDKVVKGQGKDEKIVTDELAALAEKQKDEGRSLSKEKASTKYVSNLLWGIDDIEDAGTLAASLLHTHKRVANDKFVSLYNTDTPMESLKQLKAQENNVKGTILIFVPSLKDGEKVVAYATGNGKEYKYYDVKLAQVVTFKLDDKDSPIKTGIELLLAITPNIKDYDEAKELKEVKEEKAAEPKVKDVKATNEESLASVKAENTKLEADIKKYGKLALEKRDNTKVAAAIATANQNITVINECKDGIKKQADDVEAKIKACDETTEKLKVKVSAGVATSEEKTLYETATTNHKTFIAEKKEIEGYLAKIKELETEAEANRTAAKALEK